MTAQCTLPDIGEGIHSGTVVEVLVNVGDAIAVDDPLLVLETDKAEFELPSTVAGTVTEIRVNSGQEISVGDVIVVVDDGGAAPEQPAQPAEKKAPPPPPPAPEPPEPPKAPAAKTPPAPAPPQPAPPAAETPEPSAEHPAPASPSVRRLAREIGVDIDQVTGTGAGGRITEDDVRAFSREALSQPQAGAGRAAGPMTLPDFSVWGDIERVSMSKVRVRTAENMAASWAAPRVTQFDKADITELEALRQANKPKAKDGKLTMTAILLKVVAAALRKFPNVNASLDLANGDIIYKKYVHVGVAVDTERGLLVPVIKDADKKNILQLAEELTAVSEAARGRNIRPDQMQGATFTITNLGGIGGTAFTPIVNSPEVGILGVSRGAMEPVWNGSEFVPRLMLPLSFSYDHRLVDGADGIRFVRWICEALEQPFLLALEGE